MKAFSLGGCTPNTLLVAVVIFALIAFFYAAISTEMNPTARPSPTTNDGENGVVQPASPLDDPVPAAAPAQDGNAQEVSAQSAPASNVPQGRSGAGAAANNAGDACRNGCLLDNQCATKPSIVARQSPSNQRYYYPPTHSEYEAFRNAETLGETNFYFCSNASAEAQGWSLAP